MTLIDEFKKPFNIVTLILTVLSIFLSIVFYFNSIKTKNISYLLQEPSLIFDSKSSSPKIKLYEKDTIPVLGNVYLLTGTIWNSGDIPIDKSDIRVPLSIYLLNSNRILDFKIIKAVDSSIANFSLNKIYSNSLKIDWSYFDPKFGFSFQIIYVGESDPEFMLKGKILDISSFEKLERPENKSVLYKLLAVLTSIVICIGYIYMIFIEKRSIRRGKSKIFFIISIIGFVATFICLLGFIWVYFIHSTLAPI
ncbi:MAG: hypothetical protein V4651_00475 [Bacteroidota bacterium]